jgi:hypothetical protein
MGLMDPVLVYRAAAVHAHQAITQIDQALSLGASDQLSREVLNAFGQAKQQAETGISMLPTGVNSGNATGADLQFDGASLWLGIARNLLGFTEGVHPLPPVVRPGEPGSPVTSIPAPGVPGSPVTTIPAPGEPGSPITIEPIRVQLPAPGADVQ